MIRSRLTAKSQVTVPGDVRRLLGLGPGDDLIWEQDGDRMVVRSEEAEPAMNNFATFTEWASPEDCAAFDDL